MGRYPGFAARPDRWISWWLGAVPKGLAMIRKYRPDAIWSTYPIATAHKIACTLQRLSGLPWIADFRDPMAQDHYPSDPKTWKSFRALEEAALRRAARGIFVTSGAKRVYRERYPDLDESRLVVIENGYDEESFAGLDEEPQGAPLVPGAKTILHSGIVYPSERDPTHLLRALRSMLDDGRLKPGALCVRLRASGHEEMLKRLIDEHRVKEVVQLMPPIPYREALAEMMRADGLLVLQASNCNEQIPVKLYEYLRCGRPIIGLTDPLGDTAALLRRAGMVGEVAALGIAHPVLGQAIVIVATDRARGELDAQALLRLCRERLPAFMVPARIIERKAGLPRNPNGKIDRKLLAQEFEGLFEAAAWRTSPAAPDCGPQSTII